MSWNPFRQSPAERLRKLVPGLTPPGLRDLLERIPAFPFEKVASVVVVRVVGFVDVVKPLPPAEVQTVMNGFLGGVAQAAFRNHGDATCATGSRIQLTYGAFSDSITPDDAVRSVLQMLGRAAVGEPDASLADLRQRGVHIAAGVATGTCVHGIFGGEERTFGLAVGAPVERAHTLCGLAQPETLLIDEATLAHLRQAEPDWAGRAVPHHDEVGGEAAYRL